MKESTRSAAVRTIIAALLNSRLSDAELREIARSIQFDHDLWVRVAAGLGFSDLGRDSADAEAYKARWSALDDHRRSLVDLALAAAKKQRLGKRALVELMAFAEPRNPIPDNPEAYTLKDLLIMFFSEATPSGVEQMMDRLRRDKPKDAYFEGLNRRP